MSTANSIFAGERIFLPTERAGEQAPDISSLFPAGVLTACEMRQHWSDHLLPAEAEQLGDVCDKRFAEYAAGRNGARRLLAALHLDDEPLLSGAYRQPLWPRGYTGSISHADEICAVAVARHADANSLGIDVEGVDDLDTGVTDLVLTGNEKRYTSDLPGWTRKLIFSIKESNYKCCYDQVRSFIDFQQCEVELSLDNCSYRSVIECNNHLGQPVHLSVSGKWLVESGHFFTSAVCNAM